MNRRIVTTNDGSHTIYVEELDETYHSSHGAIQEAKHVFLENGLKLFQNQFVRIFEMGFGTGLNAFLTWQIAEDWNINVEYLGIEAFPVEASLVKSLNYMDTFDEEAKKRFEQIHTVEWDKLVDINPNFSLHKIHQKIEDFEVVSNSIDLIYYDAFGPRAQSDMWDISVLSKMFQMLKPNGYLVTYCAKGQVKRDLKSLGFIVESLSGPPGKREMTRARKKLD
jgi:tRNA U34 5-methylaminomethyl-2-thiouridine-forming methyltransferase MnmC